VIGQIRLSKEKSAKSDCNGKKLDHLKLEPEIIEDIES